MRLFTARLLAAFVVGAAMLAGATGSMAHASVSCDLVVNDQAGVINDVGQVEQAAQEASHSVGADVKVVTVQSFSPHSSLDDYYRATVAACKSWQGISADGSPVPKSNLLALFMSMKERKVGIFYGDDWVPSLGSGVSNHIQSEEMGPFFRGGDFAGGFAKGIDSSRSAIFDYQHPAPAAPVTNIDNSEPMDLTGLWWVLGIGVILLGLGVGGYFGYNAYQRRRAQEAARRAAKQRAFANRDSATAILATLGDAANKAVRTAKVQKYGVIGTDVSRQLAQQAGLVEHHYGVATDGVAGAQAAYGTVTDDLTTDEYKEMESRYAAILLEAEAARDADRQITKICSDADESLASLDAVTQGLRLRLDQVAGGVESLRTQGYTVNVGNIDGVDKLLGKASEKGASLEAIPLVDDVTKRVEKLEAEYSAFTSTLQRVGQDRAELHRNLASADDRLKEARESFARISAEYAESSWESVRGNGSEAEKRLDEARTALSTADAAADLSQQRWDDALSQAQQGSLLVDEAQSLIGAIIDREANLAKAKATAQHEIELAKNDIEKASAYLQMYDDDIRDDLFGDVAEARDLLEKARLELSKPVPDYLRVVDTALAANHAADRIYDECVGEHEAAERLRNQAAAAVERAGITVNKTANFIANHSSDVGNSAPRTLSEAKKTLQKAERASDASSKLSLGQKALEQAQRAYSKAKSDFDDAEAAREAERRRQEREREEEERRARQRRQSSYSSTSSSSWGSSSSSSSSSWGGGSSSSFGGFSGGGGGSSSGW